MLGKWWLVLFLSLGVITGCIPSLLKKDNDQVSLATGYMIGGITNIILFAILYHGE